MSRSGEDIPNEVLMFFRDYADDEIEALALENYGPTVIDTLVACEPLIEIDCAYEFAACVYDRLANHDVPDSERQQLLELFGKILPRVQKLDIKYPGILGDLAGLVTEFIGDLDYKQEAIPFIQKCADVLNPYLGNAPVVMTFSERALSSRKLIHPGTNTLQ